MPFKTRSAGALVLLSLVLPLSAQQAPASQPSDAPQQVVQRGAGGRPALVLDETGQWTTPQLVRAGHDLEIYIPDLSNQAWLRSNYQNFIDLGQYVITMFTFYRTPAACRANQIGWGLGDQAHLDACAIDITYRLREATVDTNLKTVTLILAGMVDPDGNLDPASLQEQPLTRRWQELDQDTQAALAKTTEIVSKQMARYDRRLQSIH